MNKLNYTTIHAELTVSRKEYITPHYIRIYLTGDISQFENTTVGVNNKILIPPKGVNKIYFPEFDFEKMEWKQQPDNIRPTIRTYTHRGFSQFSNEIWIDFIAHGKEGIASSWAISCKAGDVLGVLMKEGKTELYNKAENYLLVGDSAGIPVLSTILESLVKSVKGICIIEVYGQEDIQKLNTKAEIDFIWLYNEHPQTGSKLAYTVKQQPLPEINRFGYVAAEFSTVKEIRNYLRKEMKWRQNELHAYAYWKSGVSEDSSAKERHLESETN